MYYATINDRRTVTWSLLTGTGRSGYPVGNLGSSDPSAPCWCNENAIQLAGDLGAAVVLRGIALIAHTFDEGLSVKFKAASSAFSGSPSPDIDLEIPILAPMGDGFTCHAWLDLATAFPDEADRTFRYVSVDNLDDANSRSVSIGEIVLVGDLLPLLPEVLLQEGYQLPDGYLVSEQSSKRGVQTRYDLGSRERGFAVNAFMSLEGYDQVMDWRAAQHGSARPMLTILDPDSTSRRLSEPRFANFVDAKISASDIKHGVAYSVTFNFEELGQGEPVDA